MLLLLLGCIEDDLNVHKVQSGSYDGVISGRVCDPERGVWLEGATVYTNILDDEGVFLDTSQTQTDADGRYELTELLTERTYTVYVQKGATTLDLFEVEVNNDPVALPDPECAAEASDSPVAVVTGLYDDLPTVLGDLGVSVHEVNGKSGDVARVFLEDVTNLEAFHMLILAGGTVEEDIYYDSDGNDTTGSVPLVQAAIKQFVEDGGVLWATDWTYDAVAQIWPGKAKFVGEDKVPNSAQLGTPGAIDAHLTDEDLKAAQGKASVALAYAIDTWPVVESVDESVVVLETGDAPYRFGMDTFTQTDSPLAFTFEAGKGRVIYTTWLIDDNVGDSEKSIKYLLGL